MLKTLKEAMKTTFSETTATLDIPRDSLWRLSWHAQVPAMREGVMALLWVMRCPKGLGRTERI